MTDARGKYRQGLVENHKLGGTKYFRASSIFSFFFSEKDECSRTEKPRGQGCVALFSVQAMRIIIRSLSQKLLDLVLLGLRWRSR